MFEVGTIFVYSKCVFYSVYMTKLLNIYKHRFQFNFHVPLIGSSKCHFINCQISPIFYQIFRLSIFFYRIRINELLSIIFSYQPQLGTLNLCMLTMLLIMSHKYNILNEQEHGLIINYYKRKMRLKILK